jgi:hypothetical protein
MAALKSNWNSPCQITDRMMLCVYSNSSPTAKDSTIGSSLPRASSSVSLPTPSCTFVVTRAPRDQYVPAMIRRDAMSAIGMLYSFDQYIV